MLMGLKADENYGFYFFCLAMTRVWPKQVDVQFEYFDYVVVTDDSHPACTGVLPASW
jgi:hypothetical protein